MDENHQRNATVSQFEVEDGVVVADHVKLDPISLSMTGFISDAPVGLLGIRGLSVSNAINSFAGALGGGDDSDPPNGEFRSPREAWEYLNQVWRERNPISVVSSLQIYRNMIITTLSAPRNASVGKSLEFNISLTEVRILEAQSGTFPAFKVKRGAKKRAASSVSKGKETTQEATAAQAQRPQSILARLLQ